MIRTAEQRDAGQIAAIYRPYCEDNCVSFESEAPGAPEVASRIGKTVGRLPWLVDDRDGTIAGYAYASPHRVRQAYRWVVEVSVYVAPAFQGRGVGRALYAELFARLRRQGYYKAYAGIVVPNPPSQAFHEALGFRKVAEYKGVGYKLGAWRDTGWWVLEIQPEDGAPAEPLPPGGDPRP
ncbi:MAG TPA: GNAT family N-acetyltransferase [Opitutaceae bacterium]|jgi:phosphinothricin acetyltransferase